MPWIAGQGVLHGLDHMGQRIEADDIGGAIGGALRAADLGAGQRVDFIETEAEGGGMVHDRENRKDADAVGDKIRRIQRTNHTFAEARGEPGFKRIERAAFGALGADDFNQMHVARRVEEVNAAEARAHRLRQTLGQCIHRQT